MHINEVKHEDFLLILVFAEEVSSELKNVLIGILTVQTSSKDREGTHIRTEPVFRIMIVRIASKGNAFMISMIVY